MQLPSPYCPQCGTAILTINIPCPTCHLGFVRLDEPCHICGQPEGMHSSHCPKPPRGSRPFILCPLCDGPRHRKDRLSIQECQWRQWARAEGLLPDAENPRGPVPALTTTNLGAFNKWIKQHPNLEAGSVPAERIIRQRAREISRGK